MLTAPDCTQQLCSYCCSLAIQIWKMRGVWKIKKKTFKGPGLFLLPSVTVFQKEMSITIRFGEGSISAQCQYWEETLAWLLAAVTIPPAVQTQFTNFSSHATVSGSRVKSLFPSQVLDTGFRHPHHPHCVPCSEISPPAAVAAAFPDGLMQGKHQAGGWTPQILEVLLKTISLLMSDKSLLTSSLVSSWIRVHSCSHPHR